MDSKSNKVSFDNNLKELEQIVNKLECGDETLEESLNLYKNGVELCSKCKNYLDNAKLQIEYLNSEGGEDN